MSWPVPTKYQITTPYGVRGPRWSSGHHQGVDFACPVGTPIYSPVNGKVVGVGQIQTWGPAFGRHAVIIEFKYKKKTYWLLLAHCSSDRVKIGDVVFAGQHVANSGAEGNVSGPHLHLEVQTTRWWSKIKDVNPQFVLDIPATVKPREPHKRTAKTPSKTNK